MKTRLTKCSLPSIVFSLTFLVLPYFITAQYTVSTSGTFDLEDSGNETYLSMDDDDVQTIPIGFDFDFFGNTYNTTYISDNGFISFNSSTGDGCCSGQFLPNSSDPNDLIAAFWTDLDGSSGYYYYETVGTAPNRRLLITFDAPYYGNNDDEYGYAQIKLFETSNVIEIHTDYWNDNTQENNDATQGIENAAGTQAFVFNFRNNNNWSVFCCDFVSFTPNGSNGMDDIGVSYLGTSAICDGPQDIKITVENHGTNAVTGFDMGWKWQGVTQTPVNYTGTIPAGTLTSFTLGQQTIAEGNLYDLVSWTEDPNGNSDSNISNDTLTSQVRGALSGDYTIGGSSPDYPTISAATADLATYGVCDSTTMIIRSGTYTEKMIVNFIYGSYSNAVVFKSESGDSSDVIIEYANTGINDNEVLEIWAYNLKFYDLTFRTLGTTYAQVVEILGYRDQVAFRSCVFEGQTNAGTSSNKYLVNGSFEEINNLSFSNCLFKNGSIAINLEASNGNINQILIENNRFENFGDDGINLNKVRSFQIKNNEFTSSHSIDRGLNISQASGDTSEITGNIFEFSAAIAGMDFENCDFSQDDQLLIANNMIALNNGSSFGFGMYQYENKNIGVYHNSFNLVGGTTGSFIIGVDGNPVDLDFKNNNFVGSGPGKGFALFDNAASVSVDFNNYYLPSGNIGRISNVDYPTLAGWQSNSGYDSNGLNEDPIYTGFGDLHSSQNLLNNQGTPIAAVSKDIDGDNRSMTNPDIGADEFSPINDDVSPTAMLSPLLECTSSQDVIVEVKNIGGNIVTSFTLDWKINGIAQTPYNYSGSLVAEGGSVNVNLGAITFTNSVDTLQFITSIPNGNQDSNILNDTLTEIFSLPLNGNYTVYGTSPDFLDLEAAISTAEQFGICGNVSFLIRDGIYDLAVVIDSIPGADLSKQLTITSESADSTAVTLQNLSSSFTTNYVIKLKESKFINISHLRFNQEPKIYTDIIVLEDRCENINISDCSFIGDGSYNSYHIVVPASKGSKNINVFNNHFYRNGSPVYFTGSLFAKNENIQVYDNASYNTRTYGVYIDHALNSIIRDNHITKFNNSPNSMRGIFINNSEATDIYNNQVIVPEAGVGILVFTQKGAQSKIYNNFVSTNTGQAILLNSANDVALSYNNAISNYRTFSTIGNNQNITLRNNNFVAAGTGVPFHFDNVVTLNSDFNNIFGPADLIYDVDNATGHSTIASWNTASSQDQNSLSEDPLFYSNTDLHVLNMNLNATAQPQAGITTDIDGETRNASNPDIGADEIGNLADDIGLVKISNPGNKYQGGLQDVVVNFRNFGNNVINSGLITWSVNGVSQGNYNYIGPLGSLETDTLILGQYDFTYGSTYDIEVFTSLPNGNSDNYLLNDTLRSGPIYPSVSGEIVIGPSNGIFSTITEAITYTEIAGIKDSVNFLIEAGTYADTLLFRAGTSWDCGLPVTFEPLSGEVIIENTGLGNHTIIFDGAKGVTLKSLTIRSTDLSFPHAIMMQNGSECIKILDCNIQGITDNSTSLNSSVVYLKSGLGENNILDGNHILYGSYGIGSTSGSSTQRKLIVINNTVEDSYYRGIYLDYNKESLVHNNVVSFDEAIVFTSAQGIVLYRCYNGVTVSNNQVFMPSGTNTGINLEIALATAGSRNLISNNYVESASLYGLRVAVSSNFSDVYHNTVRSTYSGTNGIALDLRQSTSLDVKNNIAYQSGTSVASEISNSGGNIMDYNNLYSSGSNIANISGTGGVTFIQWQAAGLGTNSSDLDPLFKFSTGFQVLGAQINEMGAPLALVTEDIQGEVRDLSNPDMGCDEFLLFNDDVGVIDILYPEMPFLSGVNPIFIRFINNGQDTLKSMKVDIVVNSDTLNTYLWSGLLPSGEVYDSLDAGQYDFVPFTSYDIEVVVSDPNMMQDELALNDTMKLENIFAGLAGIYTIGGAEPDFEKVGDAISALMLGGAADDVQFLIRSGEYHDTLIIGEFIGSECGRSITFESETGVAEDVLITNLGLDNHTVQLLGADGITFRNLSINTVNVAFAHAVVFQEGAHCNTFENCHIAGVETSSSSSIYSVIYSPNAVDSVNVFTGNTVMNGSYAFYLNGVSGHESNVISENDVSNFSYAGVFASYEGNIKIEDNHFKGNTNGIYLYRCNDDYSIQRNELNIEEGYYGIRVAQSQNADSEGRIINNMVHLGIDSYGYGIHLSNVRAIQAIHNSVSITEFTAGSNINKYSFYMQFATACKVYNNVFANFNNEGAAMYLNAVSGNEIDYNNYHSEGVNLLKVSTLNYADLVSWQTAYTGIDQNSLSNNPQFYNNVQDLHSTLSLLINSGTNSIPVLDDIDGEIRDANPDIGADEFDPLPVNDAGILAFNGPIAPFASGNQDVVFTLKNFGGIPLTSATIRWLVDGVEQTPYSWTGSLIVNACDTLTIGNIAFDELREYDILAWTESPNASMDEEPVNDSLFVDKLFHAMDGNYTLGGSFPDFNSSGSLDRQLYHGGMSGTTVVSAREGTYTERLRIEGILKSSESFALSIQNEIGAEPENIVFNISDLQPLISIVSTNRVTLKGLHLNNQIGNAIEIKGGIHSLTIDSCIIRGQLNSFSSNNNLIENTSEVDSLITIKNSKFFNGYAAIQIAGPASKDKSISVFGNYFEGQNGTVFYANQVKDLEIYENEIISTRSYALRLRELCGTSKVFSNKIENQSSYQAIFVQDVNYSESGILKLFNNLIYCSSQTSGSAFYLLRSKDVQVDHNTFLSASNVISRPLLWIDYNYGNLSIRNNILENRNGGRLFDYYSNQTFLAHDYNVYHSSSTVLGSRGSTDISNLSELQTETGGDTNSKIKDPLFSDLELGLPRQEQINNTALNLAIATDLAGNARGASPDPGALEFTPLALDIGVSEMLYPIDSCNYGLENISMLITNYGSTAVSSYDVGFRVNLNNYTIENSTLSIPAGESEEYTFTNSYDFSSVQDFDIDLLVNLTGDNNTTNDTLINSIFSHNLPIISAPGNLIPINSSMEIGVPTTLSWSGIENADIYKVFIYETGQSPATEPTFTTDEINVVISTLSYGTSYDWYVIVEDNCGTSLTSATSTFTTRFLPDLQITNIVGPSSGDSGQPFGVQWTTTNTGIGQTTKPNWSDAVYLSTDATLNIYGDLFLGAVKNLTALIPNESYVQTGNFTLPNNLVGDYYIIITADRYNEILETDNSNNELRTLAAIPITLAPSPDLRVEDIIGPNTAFSGQNYTFQYVVKNYGNAPASATNMYTAFSLEDHPTNANFEELLRSYYPGFYVLPAGEVDTFITTVFIPYDRVGFHQIKVTTDVTNKVYEFAGEFNNTTTSSPIEIFLTPPVDLEHVSLIVPDTVSNNERLYITRRIINSGGSSNIVYKWRDRLEFSPSPVYNSNFTQAISDIAMNFILNPGEEVNADGGIYVPKNATGINYIYSLIDVNDEVYEYQFEANNKLRSDTIVVVNPDLEIADVTFNTPFEEGKNIAAALSFRNEGLGDLINGNAKCRVFLSDDNQIVEEEDILLSDFDFFQNRQVLITFDSCAAPEYAVEGSGSFDCSDFLVSVSRLVPRSFQDLELENDSVGIGYFNFQMPFNITGAKNLIFEFDAENTIFESDELNNTYVIPINISAGNFPDLVAQNMILPPTGEAGKVLNINYTISNYGLVNASNLGKVNLYITEQATLNKETAKRITLSQSDFDPIPMSGSINVNKNITIPIDLVPDNYYFFLVVDDGDVIYEAGLEINNVLQVGPIFIDAYMPTDIAVKDVEAPQNLTANSSFVLKYKIENQSTTFPPSNSWIDRIYLSVDQNLDPTVDLLLADHIIENVNVSPGLIDSTEVNLLIPRDISGSFYLIVQADHKNTLFETNIANNLGIRSISNVASPVDIIIPSTPDFVINSLFASESAYAGERIIVNYEVRNQGLLISKSRIDRMFISEDDEINYGDIEVYNKALLPVAISADSLYTFDLDLPNNLDGNYLLILEIDATDNNYEYLGEDNNIIRRNILIEPQLPSDLFVEEVNVPVTVFAGENAKVSWKVKNQGANPAHGNVDEVIYLSLDTILDIDDVVLETKKRNTYLSPGNSIVDSIEAPVRDVALGDYFGLVRTDAKNILLESDENNNVTSSTESINVTFKDLFLDSLTTDIVVNNADLYYKLEIPDGYSGSNILVWIAGDTLISKTELYIKYESAPTSAKHDFRFDNPNSNFQQIVIPNALPGDYYILVKGVNPLLGINNIRIYANEISFALIAATPRVVGNVGQVTFKLKGSQFDSLDAVRLIDTSYNEYYASAINIVDDQNAYAVFNMQSVPVGMYDIEAVKDTFYLGILKQHIKVVSGGGPDLQMSYYFAPGRVDPIPARVMKFVLEIKNFGNTDAVDQYITLNSPFGEAMAVTFEDAISQNLIDEISLAVKRDNSPYHVLGPEESMRVELYVRTVPNYPYLSFSIDESDE